MLAEVAFITVDDDALFCPPDGDPSVGEESLGVEEEEEEEEGNEKANMTANTVA